MGKCIIFEEKNGCASVTQPAPKSAAHYVTLSVIKDSDPPEEVVRKTKAIKAQKYLFAIMKEREITDAEWHTFIAMKDIPDGVDFATVDALEIPTDRTFRGAWKKNSAKIEVDMPKARLIQMDRIREVRNKELDNIDNDIKKLEDTGQSTTSMKTKRQELRDIPQNFDLEAVTMPEELKNRWPDNLPKQ